MEHVDEINIKWIDFDEKRALKSIDDILSFIHNHYDIIKVNTVNFFTDNQWEILRKFSPELSQEIVKLTDEEVAQFPVGDPALFNAGDYPALHDFSRSLPQKRIEQLGNVKENIFGDRSETQFFMSQSGKDLLKNFMAPKKTHEVLNMACFVNGICEIQKIREVVDIGSGKGYLSYFLSKYYNLNVIGVDSSYINTAGASKRNFMMDKQWRGLVKSAIKRNRTDIQGSDLDPHFKKSVEQFCFRTGSKGISDAVKGDNTSVVDSESIHHKMRAASSEQKVKEINTLSFQPVTAYVNQQTDFSQFFQEERPLCLVGLHACGDLSPSMLRIFTSSNQMKILCNVSCCYHLLTEEFIGISKAENTEDLKRHSKESNEPFVNNDGEINDDEKKINYCEKKCLKSDSEGYTPECLPEGYKNTVQNKCLQEGQSHTQFIDNNDDVLINKDCCLVENSYLGEHGTSKKQLPGNISAQSSSDGSYSENVCSHDQPSSSEHREIQSGFPLSRYLQDKMPQLNKNARMVGCMAVHRVHQAKELPTEKLFYRAVFQLILVDNFKNLNTNRNVGKLAGKCKNFIEYCRRAFQKLDLDGSKITDDKLQEYYDKCNADKHKLQAFNQFRSALAPSIEGLILLDRLVYLKEQKIEQAYIVKLFNQVISPRCYAIVAMKV